MTLILNLLPRQVWKQTRTRGRTITRNYFKLRAFEVFYVKPSAQLIEITQ